jgi:catalase
MLLLLSLFKVRTESAFLLLFCLNVTCLDPSKFVDLIHAGKPEPDRDIPQAATAHNSTYDFFAQQPETAHTVLWVLSGRGTPKSFRQVEGFGVNT